MDTFELNCCLRRIKNFRGTYPCNMIPDRRKGSYVINTSPVTQADVNDEVVTGDHWVVVLVEKDGKGVYFDSSGLPVMNVHIAQFLSETCPNGYKFSNRMLQHPLSKVCGVYCVDFIIESSLGRGLRDYLGDFTSNYDANDRLVTNRTTCRLSAVLQQLGLSLKTLLH